MPVFVHNCPHCNTQRSNFTVHLQVQQGHWWSVFASCNACNAPVSAYVKTSLPSGPNSLQGDMLSSNNVAYLEEFVLFPKPEQIDTPEHLPSEIARAFNEAAQARKTGLLTAACASYRRTMEICLKTFAPDVEAWKLEKRIDKLAAENLITPAIKEWAHQLRLDGNEAVHGTEEATKPLVDQMHELTKMLLIYLYTMPEQIKLAKAQGAE